MTPREAEVRRAVALLERAFPPTAAGGPWTRERFQVWVDSVIDLEPGRVGQGAAELVRTWGNARAPFPGHLRDAAMAAQSAAGDGGGRLERDAGSGCPECRHEDFRGEWVCDRTSQITHCIDHDVGWRGVLPAREDDEMLPVELQDLARAKVRELSARKRRWPR